MANKSLDALRQVAASMAGMVPTVDDKTRKKIENHLTRVLSGTASQVYGLNEQGQPEFGKRPGIVDEVISFPELAPAVLQGTGALADLLGSRYGTSDAGNSVRRLAELASKHMPKAIGDASDRTDQLHRAVREGVDLPEAHGFTENAEDALGVMTGQLPLPVSWLRRLTKGSGVTPKLAKTIAASPLEWLSPTIDPKLSNYLSGAGFGGAMGSVADALAAPEEKAEGGRIHKLSKMLESLTLNPSARKASTSHLLEDPLENVKYAAYEANQAGKITPEDQKSLNSMVESYLNGDINLTDEALGDRLIDLHRSLFGQPPVESPTNVIVPDAKKLVPSAFGVQKKARGGKSVKRKVK